MLSHRAWAINIVLGGAMTEGNSLQMNNLGPCIMPRGTSTGSEGSQLCIYDDKCFTAEPSLALRCLPRDALV